MGAGIWKWHCRCGEAKLKEQAAFSRGAAHACPGDLERPTCEVAGLVPTVFIHLSSQRGTL